MWRFWISKTSITHIWPKKIQRGKYFFIEDRSPYVYLSLIGVIPETQTCMHKIHKFLNIILKGVVSFLKEMYACMYLCSSISRQAQRILYMYTFYDWSDWLLRVVKRGAKRSEALLNSKETDSSINRSQGYRATARLWECIAKMCDIEYLFVR